MSEVQKVVLIGASGTLGSSVLTHLLSSNFNVTILSRSNSQSQFPANIPVIRTDYTFDNLKEAFKGQDAVICCVGVHGINQQITMIDAAEAANVKRFVVDEFVNSPTQQGLPDFEYARAPKKVVMKHVVEKAEQNPGFTWSALAIGHVIDLAIKRFPMVMGFSIPDCTARICDGGDEPFTGTTIKDIAIAVTGILKRPAETANKFLHVRSLQTTQNEILAAFEEQMGKKWKVVEVDTQELLARGRPKHAAGDRSGMLDVLTAQLFEKGAGRSIAVSKEGSDGPLLGLVEQDTATLIADILADV